MATDKNKPIVSIVVPCRNERDHIETVLKSILAQQPPPGNFEVIVTDGMSDDGTREIILRLARVDSRVRMVDNRRGIVSTGLNAAIREARGFDHHTHGRSYELCAGLCSSVCASASRKRLPTMSEALGSRGVREEWAKLSRLLFNPLLLAAARGDTIRIIQVRSIRFIWDVGVARFSTELDSLTRSLFAIRMMSSTLGLSVAVVRFGSQLK